MATVLAYASILALITDFGFGIQALRDIGAEPGRAGELIAACFRVKNLLVTLATLLAVAVLLSLNLPPQLFTASVMLYGSIMLMSYGDLAIMALRGIGRYDVETYAVFIGAGLFVVIVSGTALVKPELLPLSAALLVARAAQMVVSFAAVMRFVNLGNCVFGRVGDIMRFARQSSGLALDTVLTVVPGQLDIIFVSSLLGFHAAGTYQVASRLANYVLIPLQVLAQIYLPRLSAAIRSNRATARKLERLMVLEFSGIGLGLGLAFAIIAPILTPIAFSRDYFVPLEVWVAFAILFFVKSFAAALGVALAARHGVIYRVIGQAAGVTVIVLGLRVFLPIFGMVAAPATLIAGTALAVAIYFWGLISIKHQMVIHHALEIE